MTEPARIERKRPHPAPLRRYLLALLAVAYLVAWWSFGAPQPAVTVAAVAPIAPPVAPPTIVIYVPATAPVPTTYAAPPAPTKVRVAPQRRGRVRTRSS